VIRLPFLWERLQRAPRTPFDEDELERLDEAVDAARSADLRIILDPHNDGKYYGETIGSASVTIPDYVDFLTRLAEHYKGRDHVIFSLMNEVYKQPADVWGNAAQAGINALRNAGAEQLILVPGTLYSRAYSWRKKAGRFSNADIMARIKDPLNHMAIEVHEFFDINSKGMRSTCVDELVGERNLSAFTHWLRATGHRGFLGEFGVSTNPMCLVTLRRTLDFMEKNADVWLGWSYWAAGPWIKDFMFSIYPPDPEKFPQAKVLKDFLPRGEKN
jgi:endoglucanase